MNKFILRSLGFILFGLSLLAVLNIWVSHNVNKNDYYKLHYNEIFDPKINAKNVIIGMSQANHGIQPAILNDTNQTYFNFALDAANPSFFLKWYNNIFKPNYKKPKNLIFVVNWFSFDSKWLGRKYEQDSEYFPSNIFFKSLIQKNTDRTMLILNSFPVVKFRKTLVTELFNHDLKLFPISEYKLGFIPCEEKNEIKEFYPKNIKVDENVQQDFEELVKILNKDSINIIFVATPDFHTDQKQYKNVSTYNYLKEISTKYKMPFINYNVEKISQINSNKNYYTNSNHLNLLGSTVFSEMLKRDLKNIIEE